MGLVSDHNAMQIFFRERDILLTDLGPEAFLNDLAGADREHDILLTPDPAPDAFLNDFAGVDFNNWFRSLWLILRLVAGIIYPAGSLPARARVSRPTALWILLYQASHVELKAWVELCLKLTQ